MTATPVRNPLAAALEAAPVSERAYPVLPHFPRSFDKFSDHLTPAEQLENLLTVVRHIVAQPETLNMAYFHTDPNGHELHVDGSPFVDSRADISAWMAAAHGCGTVHCIAGHAIAMAGEAGFEAARTNSQCDISTKLLGLPDSCFYGGLQEVPGSLQRFLSGLPYATPEAALEACALEIRSGSPA